jgi:hypothetical protein
MPALDRGAESAWRRRSPGVLLELRERARALCRRDLVALVGRDLRENASPHFSHSMRPALLFRRGRYGVGRRKRIGIYG